MYNFEYDIVACQSFYFHFIRLNKMMLLISEIENFRQHKIIF